MKRNCLSTGLKGSMQSSITNCVNCCNKNQMAKELWDCNNSHSNSGDDYINGFPWPPRSYTCSFCRKEFKSAQALGGHMNVHRRDRARLRQSPPTDQDPLLNLNLNPNFSTSSLSSFPSSASSSSSATLKPVTSTLPLFVSPTPPSPPELKRSLVVVDGTVLLNPLTTKTPEPSKLKINAESLSGVGEYDDDDDAFAREDGCKILKNAEILRMDLEIGLPRDYDLDLELRLGTYS